MGSYCVVCLSPLSPISYIQFLSPIVLQRVILRLIAFPHASCGLGGKATSHLRKLICDDAGLSLTASAGEPAQYNRPCEQPL